MRAPWKSTKSTKAKLSKAEIQAQEARKEYEQTVRNGHLVSGMLAALFYHAEQNQIIESIQKVARGN